MQDDESAREFFRVCTKGNIYTIAEMMLDDRLDGYCKPSIVHKRFNYAFLNTQNNVALEMSREMGKTTSVWGLAPVYNLIHEGFPYTAYIAESQDKGEGYLRSFTKAFILDSPRVSIFVKDIIRDVSDEFEIITHNDKKLMWKVLGSGKSARGLSKGSVRPGLVILDDITTTEQASSEGAIQLKKQKKWYMSDIEPLGSKAKFIIVGTCVHELCLSHQFATAPPKGDNDAGVRDWEGYVYGITDDNGDPIWPEKYSREWIEAKKNYFISIDDIGAWYREYLNQPVADEERYFTNTHKIQRLVESQIKTATNDRDFVIIVDPAPSDQNSKKRGRDFSVIVVGCKVAGKYFAVDAMRFREDLEYQINAIFELWEKWSPRTIWIEDFGAQTYLLQAVEMEAQKRGIWLSVRGTKDMELNHKGKHPRIQNLKPIIAEQKLIVPIGNTILTEVLDQELYSYPRGKHDDVADAISYLPLVLKGNDECQLTNYEDFVGINPGVIG